MSADSAAAVLCDINGNPVDVLLDGVVYRLRTEAKLASGSAVDVTDRIARQVGHVIVDSIPPITATETKSFSSNVSSVPASLISVTFLASNVNRLGVLIVNDGDTELFVKLGAGASTISYSKMLGAKEDWFVPGNYAGLIQGVWNIASGTARITELLP